MKIGEYKKMIKMRNKRNVNAACAVNFRQQVRSVTRCNIYATVHSVSKHPCGSLKITNWHYTVLWGFLFTT
jgi:hypothetical protein